MKHGKRMKKVIMLTIIMLLVSQNIAYAETSSGHESGYTQSFLADSKLAATGTTRGMLLSSFEVSITDRGNGTVGIYGAALCHESMKEIRMSLYLDVWNADINDWEQIRAYRFSWNEDNTSLADRNAGVVAFDVRGLERGRDYQVRGVAGATSYAGGHEAWDADSGSIQVQSLDNLVTE